MRLFFTRHELNHINSSKRILMAEAGCVMIAKECVPLVNTEEKLRARMGVAKQSNYR